MFSAPSYIASSGDSVPFGVSVQNSPIFDPLGIFGPLSKNYCLYFYILAAVSFILFAISFVTFLGELISTKPKKVYLIVYIMVANFVMYLQARILYNMCIKSI